MRVPVNTTSKSLLVDVRVLLVDDDDDTRELFEIVLQEAGAEVRTARNAAEALRIVGEWTPTIVLSDLSMPDTDGLSFLQALRSLEQLRQTPAIAITGMTGAKDRDAALAAGYQELAPKPLRPDALVALVVRWAVAASGPGAT